MKRKLGAAILATIVVMCWRTSAIAGTTGSITGWISDAESLAPLPDATILVTSPSQTATTTTDHAGHFTFISLAPDRYVIIASKPGYDSALQSGVRVLADNAQTITLRIKKQLTDIAHVYSRPTMELVRPGTTNDVYSVDAAAAKRVQALGGGGGLNNAYSAIASLPGAFVPQGQQGWNQLVYVRAGDFNSVGYEYDGVPVNRAFDNYVGGTESNLGQQEVQLYTGGGPASASATGIAGFINQVIRTGTYPGFATVDVGLGAPSFYHKLSVEGGGRSEDSRLSYYAGYSGYNQDYRLVDQFNGGGVAFPYFATPIKAPFLFGLVGGAAPACVSGQPPSTLPPNLAAPSCYTFGPGNVSSTTSLSDREFVANLHFALPHKHDTARDDVQLLVNVSAMDAQAYDSQSDVGPQTIHDAFGGPLAWTDALTFGPGTFFGKPVSSIPITGNPLCARCVTYFYPSSPQNRAPLAPLPSDLRGSQENDASIFKLQYQKNFGSSAYLRLFGYTFYSSFLQNDPNEAAAQTYGWNPDYELSTHTRGAELQFADQLGAKHLLEATMNYTTASTDRFNNYTMFENQPQTGMTNLVDASGNCYGDTGAIAACNDRSSQGTFANPAPYSAMGTALASNARWIVTGAAGGLPEWGPSNTVRPRFASASIEDQYKPNDKLFIEAGLRFEQFGYVLAGARSDAYDFWFKAAQKEFCYDPQTLQPDLGVATAPGVACPIDSSTGAQEVHPNGKNGHRLLTNEYSDVMTSNVSSPRVAFTYTVNAATVLRASYGRYAQPTYSAVTEYIFKQPNMARLLFPFFWEYGFTTPRHDVRPQISDNYDISYEHHISGTTTSIKVTPFLRETSNQIQQFFLDPKTGFVSALNVGRQTSYGVEFALTSGDFARDGFAASIAYTYTNAFLRYDDFPGTARNIIDIVNDQIRGFNRLTAAGGGFACYQNTTTGTGAGENAARCASDPASIVNPYYRLPAQPLFDRHGSYYPYDVVPNIPGAPTDSFFSPHVLSGVFQYKRGKVAISPSFELTAGTYYGAPLNVPGIDPSSCGQNSAAAGIAAPDPHQAEYTSCNWLAVPNPENGNRFDNFGQYQNPWQLSINTQISYAVSPKVTATVVLVNLLNRCFGGSATRWSMSGPAGAHGICSYNGNFSAPYVSNLYNGFGPNDIAANGAPLNPYIAHAYAATGFAQPFQAFFQAQIKL